ncbi:MAG: helix-turn-helix domain-containing protein [Acidobacteriota bacterium]
MLARHFLTEVCRRLNKRVAGFEGETLELMEIYSWPGNVRELENEVERLVILLIFRALEAHDFNKSQAAAALGITRQTIIAKLKQYDRQVR